MVIINDKSSVNSIIHQDGKNVKKNEKLYQILFTAPQTVTDNLSKQIDKWLSGQMRSDEQFDIGMTPEVLKQLGANDLPVVMSQDVMAKITGLKHSISIKEIKKLPNSIADPVMVFSSSTVPNAYVILTELTDNNDNDIIVAMHLNRMEYKHKINRISSIYGKENIKNFVLKNINDGNLKYIEKNKSQEWSECRGLQLPKLNTILNSDNIILEKEDIVNRYFEQNEKNLSENKNPRYKIPQSRIWQSSAEYQLENEAI